jgi:hypothetical protein
MPANTPLKNTPLLVSKAPNLPIAPVEYAQQYQDQLLNALRLYFAQVDNFSSGILGTNGGSFLQLPFIAASYSDDQYATANNTPTIVEWDTLDSGSGFTLNVDNTATAGLSGIYKITYSIQFVNNANAIHDATVWLRINGVTPAADVLNSATIFSVPARKSAGVPSYVCGYSEVVFELNAGDKVGLWWGTDQAATSGGTLGVHMWHQPIETTPMNHPAVPSVIGSITFVSAIAG